jgi:hypothetical protein
MTDINTITKVEAISLSYFLDVSEDWMFKAGDLWEAQLLEDVTNLGKIYSPDLQVGCSSLIH